MIKPGAYISRQHSHDGKTLYILGARPDKMHRSEDFQVIVYFYHYALTNSVEHAYVATISERGFNGDWRLRE